MYLFLKKIARKILPQRFLFKIEPGLRKVFSLFYRGKKYHCSICDGSFSRFIHLSDEELLCARCGSLPRDRRLYDLLIKENLLHGKMLDFSPSRSLYRKFKKTETVEYYPADFANEFISDFHFDITEIKQEDNLFDLIICYHILEHVTDDKKAISELFRVLKPGGNLFLQTPFSESEMIEDPAITSDDERIKHFGQKDHVRIYNVEGLSKRLKQAGFIVKIIKYKEQLNNRSGFSEKEIVLHCKK